MTDTLMTLAEVRELHNWLVNEPHNQGRVVVKALEAARLAATVERMVKFVRDVAEEPCRRYNWDAPPEDARCGACNPCEARALLAELEGR